MSSYDTLIRDGTVVTETGAAPADLGLCDGQIVALGPGLSGGARETIDAAGWHVFPGVIDAHVHFNQPGRARWEGIATGSAAVAAGGGTVFFDMPLNSHPPTLDAASFRVKQRIAESKSLVDFALWGGLTPKNPDRLEELAQCGVIGFKAFMCHSGIDDFPSADARTLREGMKRAAALKLPVAVHAESQALTARLAEEARREHRTGIGDFLSSRPIQAELEAIGQALELAGETGCALHVVHVSCAAGARLVAEARRRGVDATCETCPHYLVLTDTDMERLGAPAKCAPPLRPAREGHDLWRALLAGEISTIGSDHSPAPPEMKRAPDFFQVWGGISGAQQLLPLLITEGHRARQADLSALARWLSFNVATRFGLGPRKGRIALRGDADLALIDLGAPFEVTAENLLYRHRQTPYLGRRLYGVTRRTLARGRTVFQDGKIAGPPAGRLVQPCRALFSS